MNTEVNLPVAKLLKEKGLKLNFCKEVFYENPNKKGEFIRTEMIHDWELIEDRGWYSAPTIAEVIMWLYEKHKIWISVYQHKDHAADVNDKATFRTNFTHSEDFNSPTEAYEVSILRILKYLI